MTVIFYKLIAGILIFVTSLIAVIYPIKVRARLQHSTSLEIADAFASGIFLGLALFHLLPDAIKGFKIILPDTQYPLAELVCACGFSILLLLERLSQAYPNASKSIHAIPYMMVLILIIHALIEGTALGIHTSLETAFIIFLAIIVHKGSESFTLAIMLNPTRLTLKSITLIVTLFSLMTPLGIFIGTVMTLLLSSKMGNLLIAGFNAFAAGTFLYISTLHHINHHRQIHDQENLVEFLFLFIGLMIMALLAQWA